MQVPAGGHTDSGPLDPFILPTNTFRDLLTSWTTKKAAGPGRACACYRQGMWRLCLMLSHEQAKPGSKGQPAAVTHSC